MYYYFFQTSQQMRDNELKPTLRALPNQTFPDGTPVDTERNVRAPKEPGNSIYGNRLDYPHGTVFCSSHLQLVETRDGQPLKNPYYTVYDSENGKNPDFHPVSLDPDFIYKAPAHESTRMNAAYMNFNMFGDQGEPETETTNTKNMAKNKQMRYLPSDKNGNARLPIDGWQPAYEDQVETESEIIATWMRRNLTRMGISTMARRPKVDSNTRPILEQLFTCGESTDTIASMKRFQSYMNEEKMDASGLSTLSIGPFQWYLDQINIEHQKGKACSAESRDPEDPESLNDAAFMIGSEINRQLGTTEPLDSPTTTADIKKALAAGWTVDDILEPQILTSQGGFAALASALANGLIPPPANRTQCNGNSLLDNILANPINKRPKDKDGFHVDEDTWSVLLLNVYTKENTLLVGPTGSGKTQVVRRMCDQLGIPFTIIPMSSITDPTEQLIGKMDINPLPNGNVETRYDWADFAMAVQKPGVVLLDEINRIPRNGYNILFSVLDDTRKLPAFGAKGTDKRMIDIHPDCVFFATANIGYAGTEEMDEALLNRFMIVEMDYLDKKTETAILMSATGISKEDATNIATLAYDIRKSSRNGTIEHAVSTRETLRCARKVRDGLPVEKALELCLLPYFDKGVNDNDTNCERGTVKGKIATMFNSK